MSLCSIQNEEQQFLTADHDATTPATVTVLFDIRWLARMFTVIIAMVVVVGAASNYAVYNVAPNPDHPIADVLKRFDLGHEPSIPAFYSSAVMLMTSAILLFLGCFDQAVGGRRKLGWKLLSVLFLCLAIDEAVMFHEMATAALDRLNLSGPFYFSWVIPGAAFAMTIGLLSIRFLWTLDVVTRRWMILAGVIFLSGAIGMELLAGIVFAAAENEEAAIRSLSHVLIQAVEEGLEMVGIAVFFCATVRYAKSVGLEVKVRDNSDLVEPK